MEIVKRYTIEIVVSIIGGLMLLIIQHFFSLTLIKDVLIILGIIVTAFLVYLINMLVKMRSLGIVDILNSQIEGPGSTKAFMNKANQEICFVGIAASKWVNETEEFENMLRRICGHQSGKIRFLLLSPDSDAAHRLNVASRKEGELTVPDKINSSLKKISEIVRKLNQEADDINYAQNFKVRLYSQMPIYRLTLIDHSSAYFSFYRLNSDGKKLKQLQIESEKVHKKQSNNIYNALAEYFENIWDSSERVDFDLKECGMKQFAIKQAEGENERKKEKGKTG